MRSPLFLAFGISLSYDVFDFGERRAAVREREAQLGQAQLVTLRTEGERIAQNPGQ
jgi:outer membrane protein TolC